MIFKVLTWHHQQGSTKELVSVHSKRDNLQWQKKMIQVSLIKESTEYFFRATCRPGPNGMYWIQYILIIICNNGATGKIHFMYQCRPWIKTVPLGIPQSKTGLQALANILALFNHLHHPTLNIVDMRMIRPEKFTRKHSWCTISIINILCFEISGSLFLIFMISVHLLRLLLSLNLALSCLLIRIPAPLKHWGCIFSHWARTGMAIIAILLRLLLT